MGDVERISQCCRVLSDPTSAADAKAAADGALSAVRAQPRAWAVADAMLSASADVWTHLFALQLLQSEVARVWRPGGRGTAEQAELRSAVMSRVRALASVDSPPRDVAIMRDKLATVLVSVLRAEGAPSWAPFLAQLLPAVDTPAAARTVLRICRLLGEEVLDEQAGPLSASHARQVRAALAEQPAGGRAEQAIGAQLLALATAALREAAAAASGGADGDASLTADGLGVVELFAPHLPAALVWPRTGGGGANANALRECVLALLAVPRTRAGALGALGGMMRARLAPPDGRPAAERDERAWHEREMASAAIAAQNILLPAATRRSAPAGDDAAARSWPAAAGARPPTLGWPPRQAQALLAFCLALWRAHARSLAPRGDTGAPAADAHGAELSQLWASCLCFVLTASLSAAQPRPRARSAVSGRRGDGDGDGDGDGGGDDDGDGDGDGDGAEDEEEEEAWPVCAQLWAELLAAVRAAPPRADAPATAVLRAALPPIAATLSARFPRDTELALVCPAHRSGRPTSGSRAARVFEEMDSEIGGELAERFLAAGQPPPLAHLRADADARAVGAGGGRPAGGGDGGDDGGDGDDGDGGGAASVQLHAHCAAAARALGALGSTPLLCEQAAALAFGASGEGARAPRAALGASRALWCAAAALGGAPDDGGASVALSGALLERATRCDLAAERACAVTDLCGWVRARGALLGVGDAHGVHALALALCAWAGLDGVAHAPADGVAARAMAAMAAGALCALCAHLPAERAAAFGAQLAHAVGAAERAREARGGAPTASPPEPHAPPCAHLGALVAVAACAARAGGGDGRGIPLLVAALAPRAELVHAQSLPLLLALGAEGTVVTAGAAELLALAKATGRALRAHRDAARVGGCWAYALAVGVLRERPPSLGEAAAGPSRLAASIPPIVRARAPPTSPLGRALVRCRALALELLAALAHGAAALVARAAGTAAAGGTADALLVERRQLGAAIRAAALSAQPLDIADLARAAGALGALGDVALLGDDAPPRALALALLPLAHSARAPSAAPAADDLRAAAAALDDGAVCSLSALVLMVLNCDGAQGTADGERAWHMLARAAGGGGGGDASNLAAAACALAVAALDGSRGARAAALGAAVGEALCDAQLAGADGTTVALLRGALGQLVLWGASARTTARGDGAREQPGAAAHFERLARAACRALGTSAEAHALVETALVETANSAGGAGPTVESHAREAAALLLHAAAGPMPTDTQAQAASASAQHGAVLRAWLLEHGPASGAEPPF
ncbi:hypothetical protein KFE25_012523 [Diacronema lutheri]|uniref:Exportin-1/Importin-beta-like domain-containing protein n=1 Tax=Diacronema lutheri TaxID=2081491 RepID=A0A8J5XTI7_DIALT|nr:hypothetical protein KFE25_012523 [Diacronema lutheri]